MMAGQYLNLAFIKSASASNAASTALPTWINSYHAEGSNTNIYTHGMQDSIWHPVSYEAPMYPQQLLQSQTNYPSVWGMHGGVYHTTTGGFVTTDQQLFQCTPVQSWADARTCPVFRQYEHIPQLTTNPIVGMQTHCLNYYHSSIPGQYPLDNSAMYMHNHPQPMQVSVAQIDSLKPSYHILEQIKVTGLEAPASDHHLLTTGHLQPTRFVTLVNQGQGGGTQYLQEVSMKNNETTQLISENTRKIEHVKGIKKSLPPAFHNQCPSEAKQKNLSMIKNNDNNTKSHLNGLKTSVYTSYSNNVIKINQQMENRPAFVRKPRARPLESRPEKKAKDYTEATIQPPVFNQQTPSVSLQQSITAQEQSKHTWGVTNAPRYGSFSIPSISNKPQQELEISIPIPPEKREEREAMKRKAQLEREEACQYTSKGRIQFFAKRQEDLHIYYRFGYPPNTLHSRRRCLNNK